MSDQSLCVEVQGTTPLSFEFGSHTLHDSKTPYFLLLFAPFYAVPFERSRRWRCNFVFHFCLGQLAGIRIDHCTALLPKIVEPRIVYIADDDVAFIHFTQIPDDTPSGVEMIDTKSLGSAPSVFSLYFANDRSLVSIEVSSASLILSKETLRKAIQIGETRRDFLCDTRTHRELTLKRNNFCIHCGEPLNETGKDILSAKATQIEFDRETCAANNHKGQLISYGVCVFCGGEIPPLELDMSTD